MEPRPTGLTIKVAIANSSFTKATVRSVQPSAVMSISSGPGFSAFKADTVRCKSRKRFFVVIITETFIGILCKRRLSENGRGFTLKHPDVALREFPGCKTHRGRRCRNNG